MRIRPNIITCKDCKQTKPVEEFPRNRNRCKICERVINTEKNRRWREKKRQLKQKEQETQNNEVN